MCKKKISQFLISAPSSGSGKTTVARGLMACLTRRGMKVHPFKCGPDYIDTKFHTSVCGYPSVNLDTFMASEEHVRDVYARYSHGADVCITEGMMGLFDGYSHERGSSYDVARVLGLPVILVVDAKSAVYSVAPLLSGFVNFRTDVGIKGVIFNKVGSPRHFEMLRDACKDIGVECFGYLPKNADLEQSSRYLGLDFSEESVFDDVLISNIEAHIDCDRLLGAVMKDVPENDFGVSENKGDMKIAVARNAESFSFIYQEHLDIFAIMGEVTFFDPEKDEPLPPGTDLLYLPGGYPEKHLEELSVAKNTLESIRCYAERGGKVIAECGGMMYLCRSIASDKGRFDMVGALPYDITARKEDRKLSLGYRQMNWNGYDVRGHEFHYTRFEGSLPQSIVQVFNASGAPVSTPVMREKNVIASYTHLYLSCDFVANVF